ncbi:phage major tail tube protein [Pseudomonas aeruginosa]|uniref:phage major tail tube protein n=1 Tax=Pseudomonas aeruginosa TaxID=287 RepID=UPI00193B3D4B|nr:phage major tail tube protein [Pseudomonas aeruginosa]MBM2631707.1 phage major tail tube protein [Pseudomonas aeruginosa]MBM2644404.1 phage major tail tube protein [Pseudomonas aeruginosa]MBM2690259.1 phage major tail tube protein [Pseudomonas aeruginosa]MBM2696711.1 phage major tail tube protein [Pseudomonas aeruginosa]MBM2703095.1 phage major tail tube protein [Pseudomonas aeruginosa]
MFTNRVRQSMQAFLQGLPLMQTLEEFDPPLIEFEMEEFQGGRFISEEQAKGLKALTAKLTIQGVGLPIMTALGVTVGDQILLTVQEAGEDGDGAEWFSYHVCGGKLKKLEEKTLKMKDKKVTILEIALITYTRAEMGVPVIDINTRTQKIVINGVDMIKGARRLVGMA